LKGGGEYFKEIKSLYWKFIFIFCLQTFSFRETNYVKGLFGGEEDEKREVEKREIGEKCPIKVVWWEKK